MEIISNPPLKTVTIMSPDVTPIDARTLYTTFMTQITIHIHTTLLREVIGPEPTSLMYMKLVT